MKDGYLEEAVGSRSSFMVAKAKQDEFPRTKRVATGMTRTHVESERKRREREGEREREMERHESSGWHDFSVFSYFL